MTEDAGTQAMLHRLPLESKEPRPEILAAVLKTADIGRASLAAAVLAWVDEAALPDRPLDDDAIERIIGHANGRSGLAERGRRGEGAIDPGRGLAEMIERSGRRLAEVGGTLGLDARLMRGLVNGRFDPDTVPGRLKRMLAAILDVTTEQIGTALHVRPRPVTAAMKGDPVRGRIDFAVAVESSDVDTATKRLLLARG